MRSGAPNQGTNHNPVSHVKAEQLNRTLNEHIHSMLFQANMPKSFWAEAMATAIYLINRLPSESINNAMLEHKGAVDSLC